MVINNVTIVNIINPAEMPDSTSWRRHIIKRINNIKNAIAPYVLKDTALERIHCLNSACNEASSL